MSLTAFLRSTLGDEFHGQGGKGGRREGQGNAGGNMEGKKNFFFFFFFFFFFLIFDFFFLRHSFPWHSWSHSGHTPATAAKIDWE